MTASTATAHAFALSQLFGILRQHIATNKLGLIMSDTDHVLTLYDVRRPDLYFFLAARVHLIDDGPIRQPPDLAIEIVSPGSERTDRIDKLAAYAAFGIAHYWNIDPQGRTAKAFKLRRKKYVAAGSGKGKDKVSFAPFEELEIDLGELWWPPG